MNKLCTSTALLAVLALAAGGAWAGCGGGGGGSRRPAAGNGKPAFQKAELPPAVQVKTFDSSVFEQGSEFLELEEAQITKVREGRDALRKEGEDLDKEQNAARAEYNAAQDANAANAAAAKVKAAAKKAGDFDPEKKWDGLLKKELKAEQYKKWKEYEARAKKEKQGEGSAGGQ